MEREQKFMAEAMKEAIRGVESNRGGPFGCVIVKGDEVVGTGHNSVLSDNDPTAHAEIVAIRNACKNLGTFQLDDCELYTTCEPCPMCMGAIYWARPMKVYFGNTRHDAAAIGFDDSMIYEELNLPTEQRKIPIHNIGRSEAIKLFEQWQKKADKTIY